MFPTHNNTGQNDFEVTIAGISNLTTELNWDLSCQTTCTDGGVTWKNLGASCNQLRAQFSASPSTTFSTGDVIFPTRSNFHYYQYAATNSGTTGAQIPEWDKFCGPAYVGQNCPNLDGADPGGVQWFNRGASDCRGDIVLVDLLSAN
jgi:hypothetical protein